MNSQDDPRVTIEERWTKREDGTVFRKWRVNGGIWHIEETALSDIPFARMEDSHE